MSTSTRKPILMLVVGVLLTACLVLLGFTYETLRRRQSAAQALPVLGTVADFNLTNQNGQAVSLATLKGHVWVADIIFTRCAGPCLRMTRQMRDLQRAIPSTSQAKLVTLTTDPVFDTPPVLRTYANRFSADTNRWMFLTGPKIEIARLAGDSLKLTAVEKTPDQRETPEDLFIHSTLFILVDQNGAMRGIFETGGEGVDSNKVIADVASAVKRLEAGG